jgi:hypothetical protein
MSAIKLTKISYMAYSQSLALSCIASTIPPLAHTSPPSTVIVAPLICELALLLKNTTKPAISSGFPSLLLGFFAANSSAPPVKLINPLAILLGKNPGAIALTKICLGPSSTARFFARWITAALEAEYPNVAFLPRLPIPIPATEAVMMTLDGSSIVPFFCRSGANLQTPHQLHTSNLVLRRRLTV